MVGELAAAAEGAAGVDGVDVGAGEAGVAADDGPGSTVFSWDGSTMVYRYEEKNKSKNLSDSTQCTLKLQHNKHRRELQMLCCQTCWYILSYWSVVKCSILVFGNISLAWKWDHLMD